MKKCSETGCQLTKLTHDNILLLNDYTTLKNKYKEIWETEQALQKLVREFHKMVKDSLQCLEAARSAVDQGSPQYEMIEECINDIKSQLA